MADVTRGEHGQLIVVTALILAVTFVALALVVNSAIYTENLSTRDTGSDSMTVLQERQLLESDLLQTMWHVNDVSETSDYSTVEQRLSRALADYSAAQSGDAAIGGRSYNIDVVETREGTRLRQTNETRAFTDKDENPNWTMTSDAPESADALVSVSRESLFEAAVDTTRAALAESAFHIEVNPDSTADDEVWRVYVFRGAITDTVYVLVEEPDEDFTELTDEPYTSFISDACGLEAETATIDLDNALLGGGDCDSLGFYDSVGGHELAIGNARTDGVDRARGTYDVLVGTESFNSDAFHDIDDGSQPFYRKAVYGLEYTFEYESKETRAGAPSRNLSVTTAQEAYHDYPEITGFDVTDESTDGEAKFTVDWTVSDSDGNLDRIELQLIREGILIDDESASETIDIDGTSASGSSELSESELLDSEYRIQMTVVDEDGNTDTSVWREDG